MENKRQIIKELREQGLTYQQIGNNLGISRQRVHQLLKNIKYKKDKKTATRLRKERGLTKSEYKMYRIYKREGWNMIKSGMPDFLLWRLDKDNKYIFEWREVKHNRTSVLSEVQKEAIEVLKKLGFKVKVNYTNEFKL